MGSPVRHRLTKFGTAFLLCAENGPYTLENRRATVCRPNDAAKARQYASPAYSRRPVLRSSRARSFHVVRSARNRTRFEPMKPHPPVIRTRSMSAPMLSSFGREELEWLEGGLGYHPTGNDQGDRIAWRE